VNIIEIASDPELDAKSPLRGSVLRAILHASQQNRLLL
jgi:hypothetical protein